jgi:hypothetical protein
VLVLDARGHHTRFGAEVRLRDASGRLLGTRHVLTGDGYNSQRAAPLHFGLARMHPATVAVTFMGDSGRTVQTLRNVNPADHAGKSLVVHQAGGRSAPQPSGINYLGKYDASPRYPDGRIRPADPDLHPALRRDARPSGGVMRALSASMVTRRRWRWRHNASAARSGFFEQTPFPSCDVVTASFSLHHIAEPAVKAGNFARAVAALRPGGMLVNAAACWPANRRCAWAGEDTSFPLDLEMSLLREAGFVVDVSWHQDGFAVLPATRPPWALPRRGPLDSEVCH